MAEAVVGGFLQPPSVVLDGVGEPVVSPDPSVEGGLGPVEFDNQPVDSFFGAHGEPVTNVESETGSLGPVAFDNRGINQFLSPSRDLVDNAEVHESSSVKSFNTTGRDVSLGSNSVHTPVVSPPIARLVAGGIINVD